MKKFFFLALALAVCAFTFVRCEKEKDNTSDFGKMIVGTWQFTRVWDAEDKMWYEGEDIEDIAYIFDANGNFIQDYKDGYSETYKYRIEKDLIYVGYEEDGNGIDWEKTYKISSISSDKMVLVWVDSNNKWEFEKNK